MCSKSKTLSLAVEDKEDEEDDDEEDDHDDEEDDWLPTGVIMFLLI